MGEMNSFSLLEFYDELLAEESILYEKGRDSEYFYDYVTSLQNHEAQKKTTATISPLEDQLSSQLVFKLEQKIRILTIQHNPFFGDHCCECVEGSILIRWQ